MAVCIGTWPFSLAAVEAAKGKLVNNGSALEAVECGIALVEDDIETGRHFVGRGGAPNMSGVLQCDAAIMDGIDLSFGAVAALEGIATPIRVALRVMTRSSHSFLVGDGAQRFAIDEGFSVEPPERLLPKAAVETFPLGNKEKAHLAKVSSNFDHSHDTIGLIALDRLHNIAAGVSTSGLANKYPGRVGDSPIPGCGLYADNFAGAACATGDGDEIMKFCPSVRTVDLMKQGAEPYDACQQVIREIRARIGAKEIFQIGIIAMDMKGRYGAAGTVRNYETASYSGFPFCVWNEEQNIPRILCVEPTL